MRRFLILFLLPITLCSLCSCEKQKPYTGIYRLDTERAEQDIAILYHLFGSSLRDYGAALTLGEDGRFSYYLGLTGGEGSCTVDGNTLTASVKSYAEGNRETLTLYIITESDAFYLLYPYHDGVNAVNIWWKKQS